MRERVRKAEPPRSRHITRMVPTRAAEIVDGGSLYWVIKGQLAARQRIAGDRAVRRRRRDRPLPALARARRGANVSPRPMRPFQGWRYLQEKDAPADLRRLGRRAIARGAAARARRTRAAIAAAGRGICGRRSRRFRPAGSARPARLGVVDPAHAVTVDGEARLAIRRRARRRSGARPRPRPAASHRRAAGRSGRPRSARRRRRCAGRARRSRRASSPRAG